MRILPFSKKLKQDEQGSFTIEATMIFPIILMLIILFILFSLVIYEKVTLQYKANRVVSQLAHSWGSSTMDVRTGEMGEGDYVTANNDGLYWRLTSNDIFGIGLADNGLIDKKINRIDEFAGDVSFENGTFTQTIKVEIEKELSLPPVVADIFGVNSVGASASHPIIEPVEIIRTTDFMIYGFSKFKTYAGDYIPFFAN